MWNSEAKFIAVGQILGLKLRLLCKYIIQISVVRYQMYQNMYFQFKSTDCYSEFDLRVKLLKPLFHA